MGLQSLVWTGLFVETVEFGQTEFWSFKMGNSKNTGWLVKDLKKRAFRAMHASWLGSQEEGTGRFLADFDNLKVVLKDLTSVCKMNYSYGSLTEPVRCTCKFKSEKWECSSQEKRVRKRLKRRICKVWWVLAVKTELPDQLKVGSETYTEPCGLGFWSLEQVLAFPKQINKNLKHSQLVECMPQVWFFLQSHGKQP